MMIYFTGRELDSNANELLDKYHQQSSVKARHLFNREKYHFSKNCINLLVN